MRTINNIVPELSDTNLNKGLICAANDAIEDTHFSEGLTSFISRIAAPEVRTTLDFIAPTVTVGRNFQYRTLSLGEFFVDSDDVRALGGDFKRMDAKGSTEQAKTVNRGLTIRLDSETRFDGDEEIFTQILLRRLWKNELIRAVSLMNTAAGTATSKKWTDGTGQVAPDACLRDLKRSVQKACGRAANKMLFGDTAWDNRTDYYEADTAPASGVKASYDTARLAGNLGLKAILKADELYESKSTSGKTEIVNSANVYAFISDDVVSHEDGSAFKRFVSPCEGGGLYRVYKDEKKKYLDITVEHYSKLVQTMANAVKAITVS